jgi:hypothetical protein
MHLTFVATEYRSSTKSKIERRRSRLYSPLSCAEQDKQGKEHRDSAKKSDHKREPTERRSSGSIGDRMSCKVFSYDAEPLPLSQAGHSDLDLLRQYSFSFIKDAEGSTRVQSSIAAASEHEQDRRVQMQHHTNHLYHVTSHDSHVSEGAPSRHVHSSSSRVKRGEARHHTPVVTPQHVPNPGSRSCHPHTRTPPPLYAGYHFGAPTWSDRPSRTGRPRQEWQLGTAHSHFSDVHKGDPGYFPTSGHTYTNHNS